MERLNMDNARVLESQSPQVLQTFEDLVKCLKRQSFPYWIDRNIQQAVLTTKQREVESEIAIRWGGEHFIVQCFHPLLFQVPDKDVPNIESSIVRLNHIATFPGLGFDHKNGYVYYRQGILRRENNALSVRELEKLIQNCITAGTDFHELLSEVVIGSFESSEVVEFAITIHKMNAQIKNSP
jgi:hypothetical protein